MIVNIFTSHFQTPPPIPPRAISGHLTSVKWGIWPEMRSARWGIWRLSAVGNKRISQFFDSAREPRSRVIALVDSTCVFLLFSFYMAISWNMPFFKVWSEDKLNKKFVVLENFAERVSKGKRFCLYIRLFHDCMAWQGEGFDPLLSFNGWGNWQHSGKFDQHFSKKSNAPGFTRGADGRFWNWPVHYTDIGYGV